MLKYLETNAHSTNLEDSDSIKGIFKTTNTNSLIGGKFIAECYRKRLYACFFVCVLRVLQIVSTLGIRMFHVVAQYHYYCHCHYHLK